jgi:hypothetical protein
MKSNIIIVSSVLAAGAALAAFPVSAIAAAGNVLLALGILAVFVTDYGRALKPLRPSAEIIAFNSIGPGPARWNEAA